MMNKQFNQISKDEIVNICGEYPDGFEAADILSDPDFVFTNDVNYSTVKLFDIDGNSVFVNSFTECHHYVNGGWNFITSEIDESTLHNYLSIFSILIISIGYIFIKKFLIGSSK